MGQQAGLRRGRGSKVGMAALGGKGAIATPVPDEERLAESGAGRDDRARASGYGLTVIQDVEVVGPEDGHRLGDRLEVVHQVDRLESEVGPELGLLKDPGEVGDAGGAGEHRPRDGEAGPVDGKLGGPEELADDGLQRGVLAARVFRLEEGGARPTFGGIDGEGRLGPTDVAGQEEAGGPLPGGGPRPSGVQRRSHVTGECSAAFAWMPAPAVAFRPLPVANRSLRIRPA